MLATPHVAAIDRHVVSFESSHLFPDADFVGDIDPTKQSSDASDNPSRGNLADAASRSYGRIIAYPSFIQKMQKSMLGSINPDIFSAVFHDADADDAPFQEVQTLHLTKTSARHVDCTMTVEGDKITNHRLKKSDGLTSFYVQQADDAYLETDDDELCIPLVEGSAVSFNGGLPHRTVVKSGSVKLVGPFFLSSFASVGMLLQAATAAAFGYLGWVEGTYGELLDMFFGCNDFASTVQGPSGFTGAQLLAVQYAQDKGWITAVGSPVEYYVPEAGFESLFAGIIEFGITLEELEGFIQGASPEELSDEDTIAGIGAGLDTGTLITLDNDNFAFVGWRTSCSCKSSKSGKSTKAGN